MAGLDDRVKADIKAGRLWKARDRLQGARRTTPISQWVLARLGEVYFQMGDLPEAGRVWFLTVRTGPEWEAAEQAFYDKFGKQATQVVAALHVRGKIEDYPDAVQERLRTLQVRLKAEGRFWEPRPKLFSDRPTGPAWQKRLTGSLTALVVIVILLAIGVGLYSILRWLIAV